MKRYVIFTIGEDRPGIVAAISEVLYNHGCNIEDSSMTILKNQFAIILMVAIPDSTDIEKLKRELEEITKKMGLFLAMKQINGEEKGPKYHTHCLVKIFGEDKTGIVYKASSFLASLGVNIADMRTKITGGEKKLYAMLIEAEVPEGVSIEEIKNGLSEIARELNVDITVDEIPTIHM